MTYDVAVIGGGVSGLATAHGLARRGHRVGVELAARREARAHRVDVRARRDPRPLHDRLAGRRHRADDVRALDGLAGVGHRDDRRAAGPDLCRREPPRAGRVAAPHADVGEVAHESTRSAASARATRSSATGRRLTSAAQRRAR